MRDKDIYEYIDRRVNKNANTVILDMMYLIIYKDILGILQNINLKPVLNFHLMEFIILINHK